MVVVRVQVKAVAVERRRRRDHVGWSVTDRHGWCTGPQRATEAAVFEHLNCATVLKIETMIE